MGRVDNQHEKEGGLLCGNDGAEEQDWAYKKRVVESERQLLTEIAAQMLKGDAGVEVEVAEVE